MAPSTANNPAQCNSTVTTTDNTNVVITIAAIRNPTEFNSQPPACIFPETIALCCLQNRNAPIPTITSAAQWHVTDKGMATS